MSKRNAIYTIVVGNEANKYANYCLPSQNEYANDIDAEYYVLREEVFRPEYPTGHFNLISAIDHFLNSDHERFLYLDADIVVHRNTPNIFEEFPIGEMYLRYGNTYDLWYDWMVDNQEVLDMTGLENLFEYYWSSGIILADKPQLIEMMKYWKPPYVVGQWQGEMGHMNWAIAKSGLKPTELPGRWHFTRVWADGYRGLSLADGQVDKIQDIYMMHYAGCGDKVIAIKKDLDEFGYMGYDDGSFLEKLKPKPQMNVNAGVVVLSTDRLQNTIMNDRLDIEDNIGEGIHIHYKNVRMDFTIKDFLKFAEACDESLTKLYNN
jgi:hypothetical protein